MPQIRMRLNEAGGDLPDVCMVCGETSLAPKTKNMQWCPPWVGVLILAGLLPYVIIALIMTKRTRIQAPLCERHQGHWMNRQLLMWGSFFLFGFIGAGAFILGLNLPPGDQDNVMPFICGGGVVLFLAWLVIVIVCQNTVIRPTEITDREIALTGVCDTFIMAVEDARDERRAARRQRSSRDEEFEEDEPRPRKRRPPSDAIEE